MNTAWAVGAAVVGAAMVGVLVLRADPAQPIAAPAPALTQEAVEPADSSAETTIIMRSIERNVWTLEQRHEAKR